MLQIIAAPNPVLSVVTKPVLKVNKKVLYLLNEIKEALLATRDPEGVGLAAPQMGKLLQIFVTRPTVKSPITVFINPSIIAQNKAEQNAEQRRNKTEAKPKTLEGCLSLPNIWGEIQRPQIIKLAYLDENGKPHKRKFSGFIAVIIQHEYDHLNGVLFPKRVLEQKGKLYKSHKNKEGKDVFEEIEI